MLATKSILLFAFVVQGAVSLCPSITDLSGRKYLPGQKITVQCPLRASQFYTATCLSNSKWDHRYRPAGCFSPISQTSAVFSEPVKRCVYIPTYMPRQEEKNTFAEEAQYRMRCSEGRGTFIATCRDGAWVYSQDSCFGESQGVVGLVGRDVTPIVRPAPPTGPLRNCKFIPGKMRQADNVLTFPHATRYRFICTSSHELQKVHHIAVCHDGTWRFDERDCAANNVFDQFTDFFGNLVAPPPPLIQNHPSNCPYLPGKMLPEDAGRTFRHTWRYRFLCPTNPYGIQNFNGWCNNGQWEYHEKACEVGIPRTELVGFRHRFSNSFRFDGDDPEEYPWWIFLV